MPHDSTLIWNIEHYFEFVLRLFMTRFNVKNSIDTEILKSSSRGINNNFVIKCGNGSLSVQ